MLSSIGKQSEESVESVGKQSGESVESVLKKKRKAKVGRVGGSVAEWLACWTPAQWGLGSNHTEEIVRTSLAVMFRFRAADFQSLNETPTP